jgi:hypothetical protein
MWLARNKPILLLLMAWGLSYAGDLAAFTAASVYAFDAGGAGLVAVLGLLNALPGAFLVPLVTSGSDRVRRERLLIATVVPRALLLGVAAAAMTGRARPPCRGARRRRGRHRQCLPSDPGRPAALAGSHSR